MLGTGNRSDEYEDYQARGGRWCRSGRLAGSTAFDGVYERRSDSGLQYLEQQDAGIPSNGQARQHLGKQFRSDCGDCHYYSQRR